MDKMPCLDDLFSLGSRDPVVRHCLQLWRRGDLTFEQAMILLVATLAESNRKLVAAELERLAHAPSVVFPRDPAGNPGGDPPR